MQSRREFLQRLAASALALSLDPYSGVSTEGDLYENRRLSLRLNKPPGWEFSSVADFSALRERQVLDQVLMDEPHPLRNPANLPVFLFEDPAHRRGHFAPAVGLYDEPLVGPTPPDQVSAHERMLRTFQQFYTQLELDGAPRLRVLRGAAGTLANCSYVHEVDDGTSCPLRIKSLLVFREPRVHTYYLVDAYPRAVVSELTWEALIDSIEYTGS